MANYRHTYSGSLGGSEQFAFTLHSGRAPDDLDAAHGGAAAGFALYVGAGALANYNTGMVFQRLVTVEFPDAGGPSTGQVESPITAAGTSASPSLPFECSMCVSERTAGSGRSFRGRMFLPPFHTGTMDSSTGLYAASVVTTQANALQAWLSGMLAGGDVPVVWSPTLSVATPVTTIGVGRVPDAQRGRRRDQTEAYVTRVI